MPLTTTVGLLSGLHTVGILPTRRLQHVCSHVYVNIFYGVFPFMDDKYSLLTNALGQTQVFEISFGGGVFYTFRSLQVFWDRNEYIFSTKCKHFEFFNINKSRPY